MTCYILSARVERLGPSTKAVKGRYIVCERHLKTEFAFSPSSACYRPACSIEGARSYRSCRPVLAGPFRTTTRGGNKHLSILVCAAAKKIWGAMFRSTGQFEGSFRDFVHRSKTKRTQHSGRRTACSATGGVLAVELDC